MPKNPVVRLPPNHPQRIELNDEVHARPPEALSGATRISYLALLGEPGGRDREAAAVNALAARLGVPPPAAGANHHRAQVGTFRFIWERHTEITRYTFIVDGEPGAPFAEPAITRVPADWLDALVGRTIVAAHVSLRPDEALLPDVALQSSVSIPPDFSLARDGSLPQAGASIDHESMSTALFGGNMLVGASIAGGAASAFTDFRIREDGFSRLLVLDRGLNARQAGRVIQRLLEIDTYRILALLALPIARGLAPTLTRCEGELAQIATELAGAAESDEPGLLDRLTRLAAEIEGRQSENHFRFSAAAAYDDLVRGRIAELREGRLHGLQTFEEFTERRLAPAMNTCKAIAARQESLSERVARATQLLSTRVDITREQQTHAVLASMDRRAKLQLRLQQTVEGLSIAAVTYYVVGLVGYAAKALNAAGVAVHPDIAMGVAIPIIAGAAALAIRKVRSVAAQGAK